MRIHGMLIIAACILSMIHVACPTTDDDNPQPNPQIEFDTIVDIDGNMYQTVTIGVQTWMAENLRVTRFNDGTPIPLRDYDHWWPSETPQRAYLADDSSDVNERGILYNGYAVQTGKLAPTGWHVPTDAEWQHLIDYAGGHTEAGGKLKQVGTSLWIDPNTGATNEYGFTAKPAYWRTASGHTLTSSGEYFYGGQAAYYWTRSETSPFLGLYYAIHHNTAATSDPLATHHVAKTAALSVRLIKD